TALPARTGGDRVSARWGPVRWPSRGGTLMRRFGSRFWFVAAAAVTSVAAACGSSSPATPGTGGSTAAPTGVCASYDTSADDALAHICENGVLRVATDQKYKP